MLILGSISGIQDYLFDVAQGGGGQARRLRARSFFIQLVAECAALRIRRAAGWPADSTLFCGAGKFILLGQALNDSRAQAVVREHREIERWMLFNTGAQLRFALVLETEGVSPAEQYQRAITRLQQEKLKAWSLTAVGEGRWRPETLVLPPLDTPCAICRHRRSEVDETDEETGEARSICHWCWADLEWGRRLPKATWLLIRGTPTGGDRDVCGLRVSLPDSIDQVPTEDAVAVCSLRTPQQRPPGWPTELILERRLARHIPADQHGRPLEFQEIAQQATGDNLLGVLKMDADDLGAAFGRITRGDRDLRRMTHLSKALDLFMAETIDAALKKEQWRATYTIFAGGDDLLLVGPWDLMIDFAWEVRTLFAERFREIGLTISAGLALMKPTRPIRNAAGEAEHLLDNVAKKVPAPGAAKPKDQIAAFRQVWKWEDHRTILGAATRLVKLVKAEKAERGWLHTLLEISQSRLPQGNADAEDSHHAGMAAARLAYHIGRNYPKVSDPDRDRANLRAWADTLVRDLDTCLTTETRYLPTISRYALTATRVPQKKE